MAKRQRKQSKKCLKVIIRYIAVPDAEQRLSRAVNILLSCLTTSNENKYRHDREITEHVSRENDKN